MRLPTEGEAQRTVSVSPTTTWTFSKGRSNSSAMIWAMLVRLPAISVTPSPLTLT